MNDQTAWDYDVGGPGTVTSWDFDVGGPGTETIWDAVPTTIGRGLRVIWGALAYRTDWLSPWWRARW